MSLDNDTWLDDCIHFYNGRCKIHDYTLCVSDSSVCGDYEQE